MAARRSDDLLQRRLAKRAERGGADIPRGRWWPLQRAALLALSGLIVLLYVAFIALGLWWLIDYFPAPVSWLAALMLAIAFIARPRLGRVPRQAQALSDHPALAALCAEVSAATGGRAPSLVVFTADLRCELATLGLRRTPTLTIGLAAWGAMNPPQRVAALAGEFARRTSGDPNAVWLVGAATSIIDEAYNVCTPMAYRSVMVDTRLPVAPSFRVLDRRTNSGPWFAEQVGRLLQYVARIVPALLARALAALSWAGRARAHATIDRRAVDIAGRSAVRDVLRLQAAGPVLAGVTQRLANGLHRDDDPLEFAVGGLRHVIEPGRSPVAGAEQSDSFLAARLAVLDSLALQAPSVVLTNQASAAIDQSLAPARVAAVAALRAGAPGAEWRPLDVVA